MCLLDHNYHTHFNVSTEQSLIQSNFVAADFLLRDLIPPLGFSIIFPQNGSEVVFKE